MGTIQREQGLDSLTKKGQGFFDIKKEYKGWIPNFALHYCWSALGSEPLQQNKCVNTQLN